MNIYMSFPAGDSSVSTELCVCGDSLQMNTVSLGAELSLCLSDQSTKAPHGFTAAFIYPWHFSIKIMEPLLWLCKKKKKTQSKNNVCFPPLTFPSNCPGNDAAFKIPWFVGTNVTRRSDFMKENRFSRVTVHGLFLKQQFVTKETHRKKA